MANITTTQLDDSIATIVAAEALGYLKANTAMAKRVRRDWDTDVATHGQAVQIPFLGTLTVNDKAQGSAVTLQQPADTKATVTLNKHKEVSFLLEDYAKALARPNVLAGYMEDSMKVIGEQIDGDLLGLYATFSNSVDATAAPLSKADFREARRLLNVARAPMSDRYAVISEDAEYAFLNITEATNRDYAEALGRAQSGQWTHNFMGFEVVMDQCVPSVSSEHKNLFFHRSALVLVTRPLPPAPANAGVFQVVMDEDGIGLRVTISYNPDMMGVQVTVDVLYGVAVLRNNHGVVVRTEGLGR